MASGAGELDDTPTPFLVENCPAMGPTSLSGQVRKPTVLFFGPTELNDDILALHVTEVTKAQPK
jgi:hypothetical protein